MIGGAADRFGDPGEFFDDSTDVAVELVAPSGRDGRHTIFGAEDNVVVQRQMGGRHGVSRLPAISAIGAPQMKWSSSWEVKTGRESVP